MTVCRWFTGVRTVSCQGRQGRSKMLRSVETRPDPFFTCCFDSSLTISQFIRGDELRNLCYDNQKQYRVMCVFILLIVDLLGLALVLCFPFLRSIFTGLSQSSKGYSALSRLCGSALRVCHRDPGQSGNFSQPNRCVSDC